MVFLSSIDSASGAPCFGYGMTLPKVSKSGWIHRRLRSFVTGTQQSPESSLVSCIFKASTIQLRQCSSPRPPPTRQNGPWFNKNFRKIASTDVLRTSRLASADYRTSVSDPLWSSHTKEKRTRKRKFL